MKKSLNALAILLIAGAIFTSSLSPAFAEKLQANNLIEQQYISVLQNVVTSTDSSSDELPPLDLGIGHTNFDDANGTIYAEAVWFLTINGIAQGLTKTRFGVEDTIKRVDAAMILGNYMAIDYLYPNAPKPGFRDLPNRAVKIVSALTYKGITNGKNHTYFGSELNITRGEAAVMLYNAFKEDFDESKEMKIPYTDVSSRYEEAVRLMYNAGIIQGISKTKFGTNEPLRRGQLALFIHRIYKYQQSLRNEKKSGFVAFGDSNTHGSYFESDYPDYANGKWTDQVAAVYGKGLEQNVYNAGNSGDDTSQALARLKEEVLEVKPEAATILFGINDALLLNNGNPQVSKEQFKNNLTSMVAQLGARNIKVILLTNPPVMEETYYQSELKRNPQIANLYADKGGLRKWIDSYNDIIRQVGQEQYVHVIDLYAIMDKKVGGATDATLAKSGFLDSKVGIHLTPSSNNIVAKEVMKILVDDEDSLSSEQLGVSMNAEKKVYRLNEFDSIKVTIENKSRVSYHYGPRLTIQKRMISDWVTIEQDPKIQYPAIIYTLEANDKVIQHAPFSTTELPVTAGWYRIIQHFSTKDDSVKLATYITITD